jgi:hypothetical protein
MDGLAETILSLVPAAAQQPPGFHAERLRVDMPLELYVRQHDGQLHIESSAPTQLVATTVLPVFHRVSLVMQADPEELVAD